MMNSSSKVLSSEVRALNWSSTHDCCLSWEGIGCDDSGRVTHLLLPSKELKGNISSLLVVLSLGCLISPTLRLAGTYMLG
ncbi:hypothetical protein RND81_07G060100 [Saponaria officinalis]|uniref:Leucine-rich repeat-containing N-terminal plant-type domain-containing protein n=1 Tax=Saponaria officinalis TaxID=3572 RepID=A0AAW1JMC8_SAPOF